MLVNERLGLILGRGIGMRRVVIAAAGALCALLITGSRPAAADILVNVSKSSQRMSVLVDGTSRYNWAVSTGAKRYTTPSGVYKPEWLARKWRSKQYGNAPMLHSIFFHDGYAIHGTTELARLGKIASHGCVRLHPDNAAKLFDLVQKQMANTRVVVSDDLIEAPGEAPKKKPSHFVAENAAGEAPAAEARPTISLVEAKPVVEPGKGLAAMAMAPEEAIRAASRPLAGKIESRDTVKRTPARPEKIAHARSGGFHW
jgi:hypothetical protein